MFPTQTASVVVCAISIRICDMSVMHFMISRDIVSNFNVAYVFNLRSKSKLLCTLRIYDGLLTLCQKGKIYNWCSQQNVPVHNVIIQTRMY